MKFRLLIFLILASVGFFNPHGIFTDPMLKLIFYASVMGVGAYSLFYGIDLDKVRFPRIPYIVLLAGIMFSAVMATAFHNQSMMVSVMTTLPYFLGYCTLYIFFKLDIEPERIMRAYIVLAIISGFVYACNVLTMPNNIFGMPIIGEDLTRGIIRIPVVFIEFFPVILFYAINKWLTERKYVWLWIMAGAGLMIILSVIRQVIALSFVLGILFYFRNVSWRIKALMAAAVVAFVVWILPLIPIYQAMIELSEDQAEKNENTEDIRITAWRYYTYENQTNDITPIFGNGVPSYGNSKWGIQFESETKENRCFDSDVGWAGFFWHFGIIATIALIIMFIKALMVRKSEDMQYVNYGLVFLMITSIASGPVLYYWQIMAIMMCFYFAFRPYPAESATSIAPEDEKPRQKGRFPQLKKTKSSNLLTQ